MSRPPYGVALERAAAAKTRVPPVWAVAVRDPDIGGVSYLTSRSRMPLLMAACHPERTEVADGLCSACVALAAEACR